MPIRLFRNFKSNPTSKELVFSGRMLALGKVFGISGCPGTVKSSVADIESRLQFIRVNEVTGCAKPPLILAKEITSGSLPTRIQKELPKH